MTKKSSASAITWPKGGELTKEWVTNLASTMEANTHTGPDHPANLRKLVPKSVMEKLLKATLAVLEGEGTLVQVTPSSPDVRVNVVGDTHGQFHDALRLMHLAGEPSETNWYVFNGDFVDRGAWGAELVALVFAWKVCSPQFVTLTRGNHECEFCTEVYGYKKELEVKYGTKEGRALWRLFMRVASELPLAAQVASKTLVLHGGLWRSKKKAKGKKGAVQVGTLAELAKAWKGGDDPDGEGDTQIAGDVLWSDPGVDVEGMIFNDNRGIGTMFGPDATKKFMETNGIELVLRSHEGPDAREDRVGMNDMTSGFSLDHDIEGVGKLCTVFSAPDYPQFVEEGERRFNGRAAFVTLTSDTDYCEPAVTSFEAVKPRPRCDPYYDVTVGGSDEEGPDGELAATIERNGTPMDDEEEAGDDDDDDGEDFAAAMGGGSLTVTESDGDTVSCDDETVVVEGYDASFVPDSDGEGEEEEDHHGTKRPR